MWNHFRYPQLIPDFHCSGNVRRFVIKREGINRSEITDLARLICSVYLTGRSFADSLQVFLDLCFTIDRIKIQQIGPGGTTHSVNFLMQYIAGAWIASTDVTAQDGRIVDAFATKIKDEGAYSWYYPKVLTVYQNIRAKLGTEWFVNRFHLDNKDPSFIESLDNGVDQIDRWANELMGALLQFRRYGIKPAYFQDGNTHLPDQAWVNMSTEGIFNSTMDPLGLSIDTLSWIHLARREDITNIRYRDLSNHGSAYTAHLIGASFPSILSWFFTPMGELEILSNGLMSARDIFARHGKLLWYSLVRMAHILYLYDLVVPIEVIKELPLIPPTRRFSDKIPDGKIRINNFFTPQLIIPRIVTLTENGNNIVEQFDRERDEDEVRTKLRLRHQHECIDHVRILPEGRRASADAKERARKAGICLAQNETYVRKHVRGSEPALDLPHEAKRR